MKILVVDDNAYLAATIQETLEGEGFETMLATDGVDGYSTYLHFEPDLVITDIQMPRKNGLEMMEDIRTHNPQVKTIYMSGDIFSFQGSLLEEKKKYPIDFFEKPFSFDALKKQIFQMSTAALQTLPV